jgi:heptosyltransferase III
MKELQGDIKKILVVRSDAIGDMVLTLPAIKAIKEKFPDAHLCVLASPINAQLLPFCPFVDEVILKIDERGVLKKAWGYFKLFGKHRFDLVIHYSVRNYIVWPSWLKAKYHVGDKAHLILWPIFRKLGVFYGNHNRTNHVLDYNFEILKKLGIKKTPETRLALSIPQSIKDLGLSLLCKAGVKRDIPIIGIHCGVGFGNKAIEAEKYVAFIKGVLQQHKVQFVLTGYSEKEKELVRYIRKHCSENVVYVETKTLDELLGVIANYTVYISVDTGPFHIAASLGIPMLAIFPTKRVKPVSWGPLGTRHFVVRANRNCFYDCPHQGCPYTICSDDISVADMVTKCDALLEGKGVVAPEEQRRYWFKESLHTLIVYDDKTKEEAELLYAQLKDWGFYAIKTHAPDLKIIRENDIAIIKNITGKKKLRLFYMAQKANKVLHHPPLCDHSRETVNSDVEWVDRYRRLFKLRKIF